MTANAMTVAASSTDKSASNYPPAEKWRIWKNVIVIGITFMVHFTAFTGTSNLQSSINAAAGLGTVSLATIYFSLAFSNIFLPAFVIKWIGCKWTMAVAIITYMPYIAAQFSPSFYTLIPAAVSVGIGGGPLWVAKCSYLTVVAEAYSSITNEPTDVLVSRFFGMFFMIFQISQVWGNLISSLILEHGNLGEYTMNDTWVAATCGSNYLASSDSGTALEEQPEEKIQMMTSIYLVCMGLAFLIMAVGVDSLKRYEKTKYSSTSTESGLELLSGTIALLKEPKQLLVIIMNLCMGLSQAFVGAGFTAAFVSCSLGTGYVGYVMMSYGICNAIAAFSSGLIIKVTGRPVVTGLGAVLQAAVLITLMVWTPSRDAVITFFVLAGLLGICDGVWNVQMNTFCGLLFPGREEAAYSNFRLWESLGYIIAYLYSPYLTVGVQLILLLSCLIVGVTLYMVAEYRHHKADILRKKEEKSKSEIEGYDNPSFVFGLRTHSGHISIGKIE